MSAANLHAFLPPSGAGAWVYCAAWPIMNATYPQDDTEESREGTAAHWCWTPALLDACLPLPAVGTFAPNGVQVTDEMLDGAEEYIDIVTSAARTAGRPLDELRVEQRVAMPGIHAQNWGTPDTWFYDPHRTTIHLFDYKFGHDPVDAYENWQLVDYANGIIDEVAGWLSATWQHEAVRRWRETVRVRCTVVQPRNYQSDRVTTWEVSGADLVDRWLVLKAAAEGAMQYPPLATPGDHCGHCPGRHACAAVQRAGYQAGNFARQVFPSPLPTEAVAAELAILQDSLAMLKARISGLEADAEARLRRGEAVPGYGLESTKGRESWRVPLEQVAALGKVFNIDVEKPALITPNQARKAGMPPDVVAQLAGASSGVKLARVDQRKLAKAFGSK